MPARRMRILPTKNFYPRSPRGERHTHVFLLPPSSIFLSTLPARGATRRAVYSDACNMAISIHAPREGSDHRSVLSFTLQREFLSTLPARGATALCSGQRLDSLKFLSTLPARGATVSSQ